MRIALLITITTLCFSSAAAQTLYKYQGEDGEWIFSDRPINNGKDAEVRNLGPGTANEEFSVSHDINGSMLEIRASNPLHVPVEVTLRFNTIEGLEYPHPDDDLRWVVEPQNDQLLLSLEVLDRGKSPVVDYKYDFLAGDPTARHTPQGEYRVPYAIGADHRITQAFPDVITHQTPDSRHAIDIAMPIGTDVFAARDGVVFDVASTNFKGGVDINKYGRKANVVRILHEDGTYAVYAHLNWNSIRVRPGERVSRGQYIADSGNTGFSSGPHLHFAVQRNVGMRVESVPVSFAGMQRSSVMPATGMSLTAY